MRPKDNALSETVYTIGHSTHLTEEFIRLLKMHSITAVCDVRSQPYSQWNPQFNRETLLEELKRQDIEYVFLGEELGARSNDLTCYRQGKVQYELLSKTPLFKHGLERVKNEAKEYRVALMCAEKDPLQCHRTILVARNLVEQGPSIQHILFDGKIESQEQSIERLLKNLKMPSSDLFKSKDEIVRDAYRKQGDVIAYSEQGRNERAEA